MQQFLSHNAPKPNQRVYHFKGMTLEALSRVIDEFVKLTPTNTMNFIEHIYITQGNPYYEAMVIYQEIAIKPS